MMMMFGVSEPRLEAMGYKKKVSISRGMRLIMGLKKFDRIGTCRSSVGKRRISKTFLKHPSVLECEGSS
jgi:hypothetical protein